LAESKVCRKNRSSPHPSKRAHVAAAIAAGPAMISAHS
jgi:hypothetical protein